MGASLELYYRQLQLLLYYKRVVGWFKRYVTKTRLCGLLTVCLLTMGILGSAKVDAGFSTYEELKGNADAYNNMKIAWAEGIKLGYSEAAVSGMLVNANAESGFSATAIEVGSGAGFGLFQWTNTTGSPRRTNFENWLSSNGYSTSKPEDILKASMDYMDIEFKADPNVFASYSAPSYYINQYPNLIGNFQSLFAKEKVSTLDEFKKMKDPEVAAAYFVLAFERPRYDALAGSWSERMGMAQALYDDMSGTAVDTGKKEEESSKEKTTSSDAFAYSEDLLPNMPKNRDYKETEDSINKLYANVDALSQEEKVGIQKWKAERDYSITERTITYMRRALMIVSIILLVYPAILTFAYSFDLWWLLGGSPLLRLVTFNKRAIDYDRSGGKGLWFSDKQMNKHLKSQGKPILLGIGDVIVWDIIFSILGLLGVSGYLYQQFGNIEELITTALGYFGN